jgi:hypothetical protein
MSMTALTRAMLICAARETMGLGLKDPFKNTIQLVFLKILNFFSVFGSV